MLPPFRNVFLESVTCFVKCEISLYFDPIKTEKNLEIKTIHPAKCELAITSDSFDVILSDWLHLELLKLFKI